MPNGQPNILVLWGDDIGISNLSCYSNGLMGYQTPNIDRIAKEGAMFTDYYGEQSCTAGRAAFITGQNPYRTGLTKVGMPGADLGLRDEDPTIATALKAQGYVTGQFGKNHFGDRDEFLPTNHGFDEFFGNLYHLNAEEEPEDPDYPTEEDFPNFRERFGPRGVIHSYADGRIEDTGPLTKKRMETVDDEIIPEAQRFITDAADADTPFFVWFNTTGMHFRTHIADEIRGQAGRWQSEYHDAMVEHDKRIGSMLDLLDELGLAEDTIVIYSTDNGVHMNTWPDAGMTPFRNEKNSSWEGAFRVPALVRWPDKIDAGIVLNGIVSHGDWFPTFLAAAGAPDICEELQAGKDSERHGVQGASRRVQPTAVLDSVRPTRASESISSTSPTTATSWRCGSATGRSCSLSSAPRARCACGPNRSPSCGCRRSSTCGRIRSNAPTSPPTPTTTGCSATHTFWFLLRLTSCRWRHHWSISRLARNLRAST